MKNFLQNYLITIIVFVLLALQVVCLARRG